MTYLELVNEVMIRLRESTVSMVDQSDYSKLIARFVNDAKRQVEDAWNWDALNTTLTVTTSAGTSNYVVTGSGRRHRDTTVNDVTNLGKLENVPIRWIEHQQQLSTVQNGPPDYFTWYGTDGTDSKLELYPTPDGTYTLKVNLYVPQVDLSADADVITVPSEPVIAGAFARALVERGEDGGLSSGEAYGLYKSILADYISLEKESRSEYDCWVAC